MSRVIELHVEAPAKPAFDQPCNGCGVCCATSPCPLGMLISGRTQGACSALVWLEEPRLYRCGLISQATAHLPPALRSVAPLLEKIARRSIGAGLGCDCRLSVESA